MSEYTIKCPRCSESLTLPNRPSTAIKVKCGSCGYTGTVPSQGQRKQVVMVAKPVTKERGLSPVMLVEQPRKRGSGRWIALMLLVATGSLAYHFRANLIPLVSGVIGQKNDTAFDPAELELSSQAFAVLNKHCADCHGNGNAEGGFDSILDAEKLVDGHYVTKGRPSDSEIYARLIHDDKDEQMPPHDVSERPTSSEIETIRNWIENGAILTAFNGGASALPETSSTLASVDGPVDEIALRAKGILKETCYRCHGESGRVEGGFNFVLQRDKLIDGKFIVPGNANAGTLMSRLRNNSMPPRGENPRPSAEDLAVIASWVEAGAPDFNKALKRTFVTNRQMFDRMEQDLRSRDAFDREFTRYFTLTHLYNAGTSDDEMETYRLALTKLLNSLSRQKDLMVPGAIDDENTILRIDLRQLKWDQKTWQGIIDADPYALKFNDAKNCSELTGCGVPSVRADWFVHKAAQPALYHKILEIPETLAELLKQEQVDIDRNIREGVALRGGFNESGVSDNNRLIERHPSTYGAFWISYDFAGNEGHQNLFSHPLGPGTRPDDFKHDGGEIIFSLPNGLQAYMLVTDKGKRIDQGPIEIVKDPKQGNAHVSNGVSCISCHYAGIIPKNDAVAATVRANPSAYGKLSEEILRLYRSDELLSAQQSDAKRFQKSLATLGITLATENGEPVFHMSKRFEDSLDLKLAAAELGFTDQDLETRISSRPEVARILGALKIPNGTIKRDRFLEKFTALAVAMGVGTEYDQHDPAVAASPTPSPEPKTDPTPLPAGFRTWRNRNDETLFTAKLTSFDGSAATFSLADRSVKTVSINELSDADQALVLSDKLASNAEDLPPKVATGNSGPAMAVVPPEVAPGTQPPGAEPVPGAVPLPESKVWHDSMEEPIVEAILVAVDGNDVLLRPGPRSWSYKNYPPNYGILHVVKNPKPGALGRGSLSLTLIDPATGRTGRNTYLEDYSEPDIAYIKSIEQAIMSGKMTDLTDPNRGYLKRYGILWKVQLDQLSPEDIAECQRQKALLPAEPTNE